MGSSLTPDTLKVGWRNRKHRAKTEVSQHKASVRATGGGPPPAPPSTEAEKIMSIVGHSGKDYLGFLSKAYINYPHKGF